MKNTLSQSEFIDMWRGSDREDSFSYEGKIALFDMFEELEPDMEVDIVGIDCYYTESSILDVASEYGILEEIDIETEIEIEDDEVISKLITDQDEIKDMIVEHLESNTMVIRLNDETVIYQNY